jgi:hypothetical protein
MLVRRRQRRQKLPGRQQPSRTDGSQSNFLLVFLGRERPEAVVNVSSADTINQIESIDGCDQSLRWIGALSAISPSPLVLALQAGSCDVWQSFSMESSGCLPCDAPQKRSGLEPWQYCRRCGRSGLAIGALFPAPGSKALVASRSFSLRLQPELYKAATGRNRLW